MVQPAGAARLAPATTRAVRLLPTPASESRAAAGASATRAAAAESASMNSSRRAGPSAASGR
ncbi:hypothetical protein SCALM49S_10029 [Streptomyces californicus]